MVSRTKIFHMTLLIFACSTIAATASFGGGLVTPTMSRVVEGCDPEVFDAMTSAADARAAYSAAIDNEMFGQPDSVLALTCFNQLASISANMGGVPVFSKPFVSELNELINPELESIYSNFQHAPGYISAAVNYSRTDVMAMIGSEYNCPGASNLWSQGTEEGVNTSTPYVTFRDLIDGGNDNGVTPPGTVPGSRFEASWTQPSTQASFKKLQNSLQEISRPEYREKPVPSFASATTACEVVQALNPNVECE